MSLKIREVVHNDFEALKSNKNQYYEIFYKNNYNLVYKICFSILKNQDNSEDVTQNVFEKILKMSNEKYPKEYEASWLYTVTKNEALQYIKSGKNQVVDIDDEEVKEKIADNSNNIESVISNETYKKIVKKLNKKQEQIISLKVISGFTFNEIGQIMSMPTATVQWHYYASIRSLKIVLANMTVFVIALFTGQKMYENEEISIKEDENQGKNIAGKSEENFNDSSINNSNSIINSENKFNQNEIFNQFDIVGTEKKEESIVQEIIGFNVKSVKFATCITAIFFVCLIIFIFFKKNQQKIKIKLSKK